MFFLTEAALQYVRDTRGFELGVGPTIVGGDKGWSRSMGTNNLQGDIAVVFFGQEGMMAGGGVASEFDPIHTTQFSEEELRAVVEVAKDYGSYVLVHAYHDRSVNRAIDAGVKVIEHNFLVSEDTIKRMKKEGVALSLQAVMSLEAFADPESITFFSPDQKQKASQVNAGAKQMIGWAFEHDLLIVTGGDMFGKAYVGRQADNLRIIPKEIDGVTPYQVLKTATSDAATVLSWSGGMNPYKYGTLGTIAEGGYADIILVDGNPLENLSALGDVVMVVKDGAVAVDNR